VTGPAFPPQLTPVQAGPVEKHGVCAFAPVRGCGELPARFYVGGWRCVGCGPGAESGNASGETSDGGAG
jgi:hypothetical protein